MKREMISRWGLVLIFASLLLAACVSEPEIIPEPSQPAVEAMEASGQNSTEVDSGIPEPELGFEHGDPNLKATAPSSFVQAAGKPQLVELFAFW